MGYIKINVGGKIFETTKETLSSCEFFKSMFNNNFSIEKDDNNVIFISRSPKYFKYILEYLSGYEIDITDIDEITKNNINNDCKYYGLESLFDTIDKKKNIQFSSKEKMYSFENFDFNGDSSLAVAMRLSEEIDNINI